MSLGKKLVLLVLTGNLLFFVTCSVVFLNWMKEHDLKIAAETYENQMTAAEYVLSEIVSMDGGYGDMGELAAEAYLKYQFRQCFGSGYALLKNGECLVNLTDFAVLDPMAFKGNYMVQQLGDQTVFLMMRQLDHFPGFQVLLARDITSYHGEIRQQIGRVLILCAALLLILSGLVYVLLEKMLKPLTALAETAKRLGEGDLTARAELRGRNEIGTLSRAFDQMAEQVEQQVAGLQLLLGALVHEIRTPVTGIIGYAQTLLYVKLSKEKEEQALCQIVASGQRLERLSTKMLSFLGTYEEEAITMEWLSLRQLFEEAEKELEPVLLKYQAVLLTECEPDRKILGDRELLGSLFCNLLHNGAKAVKPGGKIRLLAEEKGIRISDEGEGIEAEALPHVTKAFYMTDKSRSRSEGGSGLGLALCQRIAKLHQIRMEIHSEKGKGTTVELLCGDEIYKTFTT